MALGWQLVLAWCHPEDVPGEVRGRGPVVCIRGNVWGKLCWALVRIEPQVTQAHLGNGGSSWATE